MADQRVSTQSRKRAFSFSWPIQHASKFMRAKISVDIGKGLNSHRIGLGLQHGRRFFVLEHQYRATMTSCENVLFSSRFVPKHHVFPSGTTGEPFGEVIAQEGPLIRCFKESGSTYQGISFFFLRCCRLTPLIVQKMGNWKTSLLASKILVHRKLTFMVF